MLIHGSYRLCVTVRGMIALRSLIPRLWKSSIDNLRTISGEIFSSTNLTLALKDLTFSKFLSSLHQPPCLFVGSKLNSNRLVISPMSGNSTFETSDFADLRFSFRSGEGASLSLAVFLLKKLL